MPADRAEQRLRMCTDGRGLGSKLVSFAKGFSKHPHILAIFKVDSEYLRLPFRVKVDYFILHSILVFAIVMVRVSLRSKPALIFLQPRNGQQLLSLSLIARLHYKDLPLLNHNKVMFK